MSVVYSLRLFLYSLLRKPRHISQLADALDKITVKKKIYLIYFYDRITCTKPKSMLTAFQPTTNDRTRYPKGVIINLRDMTNIRKPW